MDNHVIYYQSNTILAAEVEIEEKMMITLDLPKELEDELIQEAEQLDLSLSDYALRLLYTRSLMKAPPKTGIELVSYWQSVGVIGMRPDIIDSSMHARKIRATAQRR